MATFEAFLLLAFHWAETMKLWRVFTKTTKSINQCQLLKVTKLQCLHMRLHSWSRSVANNDKNIIVVQKFRQIKNNIWSKCQKDANLRQISYNIAEKDVSIVAEFRLFQFLFRFFLFKIHKSFFHARLTFYSPLHVMI